MWCKHLYKQRKKSVFIALRANHRAGVLIKKKSRARPGISIGLLCVLKLPEIMFKYEQVVFNLIAFQQ